MVQVWRVIVCNSASVKIDAELACDLVVMHLLHHCSSCANMFVSTSKLKLATATINSDQHQQAHACHCWPMPSAPCRLQEAGEQSPPCQLGTCCTAFLISVNELMLTTATDSPILCRQTLSRLKVWGGPLCIHRPPSTWQVSTHLHTATLLWHTADLRLFP